MLVISAVMLVLSESSVAEKRGSRGRLKCRYTELELGRKVAARALVAKRICASLGLKPEEERHRFGFAT